MNLLLLIGYVLVLILIYIALAPCVAIPIYRSMLFHPVKYPEGNYQVKSINGISCREVFFTASDGTKLHGWYFPLPGSTKTILFHHGNAYNITSRLAIIDAQLQAGASVFIYDYRGFGRSEGVPDLKGICDDGCAAFDYLVNHEGIDEKDIINYGESLGGGVACQVSSVRSAGGLILQSTFSSLRKIGVETTPWIAVYPKQLFPTPYLDNLAIIKYEHPPLLILHGCLDAVVPLQHGQDLFRLAIAPKKLIEFPRAHHADLCVEEPDLYLRALREFITTLTSAQCF